MTYKDIILAAGWTFEGSCRCGGVLKEKYKKNGGKLLVYPTRNRYILKNLGALAVKGELDKINTVL